MTDLASTRPAPTASGTLAKTPLVHLLLYAAQTKLSGTIELFAPDKRSAAIVFLAGEPAKVRTSEPVAYLGRVLLELGHLTESQLDQSLAELAAQKREGARLHGELLRAKGIINETKLHAGLEEQLARKLRFVSRFPAETAYAYFEGFDSLRAWGGEAERGVDSLSLLWGVLRESPPWNHVNAGLARVEGSPLRLSRAAEVQKLGLGQEEAEAAALLRARPLRVEELARAGHLDEQTARLLAYLLLVTKQVDALPANERADEPAQRDTRVSGAQPTARASVHPSPPPARSAPSPRPEAPAPRPSIPSTRPPARAPVARISGSPDSKLAVAGPPQPPKDLSPELAERWREIVERATTIDRADYFMMLDIPREANGPEAESAFFAMAKRWHPDRLPPELAPVRDYCSRVFARMGEARATLTDEEQRAHYMKLHADGSGSPEMQETVARVVEAAGHFQKAEVCFKRNDFAQAEALCRKALQLDATQPDYVAMLAWLTSLKPENQAPEKTLACIEQLGSAIKMSERCEKAYFWRGMLYRRLGKDDLAVRDFRLVIELNPRNIDAAREVRLHQMRSGGRGSNPPPRRNSPPPQKNADPSQKSGIFGRLFKKP
jgi:tetratricopeptide (TPR) repeat protein